MKIDAKIISSLEKVFLENNVSDFKELKKISLLKGERVSFQVIYRMNEEEPNWRVLLSPKVSGQLAEYVTLRDVKQMPVEYPLAPTLMEDDNYLKKEPGLYPDLLTPVAAKNRITATRWGAASLWIDIDVPEDIEFYGESALTVTFKDNVGEVVFEGDILVDLINAKLPKQEIVLTQWFYCDAIAQYYEVPVWSEKHWEIIENFARVGHKDGINLILTPVFTPELDTEVGGERLTTQLVGVTVNDGKYSFDFSLVDRWVDMCDRVGIEFFEISHLFSQWGAKATPKIMATVDGEYKQIFGWNTVSTSDEYRTFLRQFLTEFIAHMKKRGDDKRCFYHISDEPSEEALPTYKACNDMIADLLEGYTIMDALSSFEFFKQGVSKTPIPHTSHIDVFIENKVPNLWAYYCGAGMKISGRSLAMPSWRNRCLGMQLYKYNIVGFLHWGYNFYNACWSTKTVNPYNDCSGDRWVVAGDTYMVYPGPNGECLESLRNVVFGQAIEDISAMKLAEKYYSHEEVVAEIEKIFGGNLKFDTCPKDGETMLAIRERINEMIKAKL